MGSIGSPSDSRSFHQTEDVLGEDNKETVRKERLGEKEWGSSRGKKEGKD